MQTQLARKAIDEMFETDAALGECQVSDGRFAGLVIEELEGWVTAPVSDFTEFKKVI